MDLRSRLRALESRLGVGQPAPSARPRAVVGNNDDANDGDPNDDARRDSDSAVRDDPANFHERSAPVDPLAARLQRYAAIERERAAKRMTEPELARMLGGDLCADGVILVEQHIPASARHGSVRYSDIRDATLDFFADGVEPDRESLVFIDTETTGLAGGSGTIAFLLGLVRLRGDTVEVRQYVLTRFAGEAAMLAHALEWLTPSSHLVSFNGKTFDLPLLATRYRLSRLSYPLADLPHIDLLHRTRAAFGRNWPDCRLQTAERELLKLFREDDIPGHMIPEIWADWLQRGETRHLKGVVEHNFTDLLSLVAVATVVGRTYAEPGHHPRADALGLSRALRKSGNAEIALRHLEEASEPLPAQARLELAAMYARSGEWDKALPVWNDLARNNVYCAMERLAMYHEHQLRDYPTALRWADAMAPLARDRSGLDKRRARLMRKSARA